jgi:hypothetical protein
MINWGAFVLVAVVSIGATVIIVGLFAGGLRLLAVESHRGAAVVGAYACFVVAALATLYGIYLLIPALHP